MIRGLAEIRTAPQSARGQRIRHKGAGRKRTVDQDATLKRDLEALVEPVTRGDPGSPLRWTCKSVRQLATELKRTGHRTSHRMLAELLHAMDYSLQANRKRLPNQVIVQLNHRFIAPSNAPVRAKNLPHIRIRRGSKSRGNEQRQQQQQK